MPKIKERFFGRKVSDAARSAILACAALLALSSCFTPSPLYGTWSDNFGDKITLSNDSTYTAIIDGLPEPQSGSFSVAENIISFSTDYGLIVTEWDIRGSILYLDWTMPDDGYGKEVKSLKLYHN